MRCPAIEGIETCAGSIERLCPCHTEVECVAPLLRGLKQYVAQAVHDYIHVECVAPLLRGLKPGGGRVAPAVRPAAGRMRCPAIEGIETKKFGTFRFSSGCPVECVAPLLRGLKQDERLAGFHEGGDWSNALPRY